MLHYAVIFFVIALIAAVFGFRRHCRGRSGNREDPVLRLLILAVVSFIANTARR
jgi:uncharacterized membrane protein YtjA (UPF0391 family)